MLEEFLTITSVMGAVFDGYTSFGRIHKFCLGVCLDESTTTAEI